MEALMRRTLSLIAACFLLAAGALTVQATVKPATASAFVFAGSCGWTTAGGWHFSPAYGIYYTYQGHVLINGYNYRRFLTYAPATGTGSYYVVYCG